MNCKPGDMALIISGVDTGKVLTVSTLAGDRPDEDTDLPNDPQNRFAAALGPVWRTDRAIRWYAPHQPEVMLPYCPDAILVPIAPDADMREIFRVEGVFDRMDESVDRMRRVIQGSPGRRSVKLSP